MSKPTVPIPSRVPLAVVVLLALGVGSAWGVSADPLYVEVLSGGSP